MAVKRVFAGLLLAFGTATLAMAAAAGPSDPASVVKEASTQIVQALNQNEAKLKADPSIAEDLVKKYLLPHFDFPFTCQLVLGRYWRTATAEQREEFEKAFLHYLTTTYAKGLEHFHGATIDVLPFRGDTTSTYVKVRTQVKTPDHEPVEVDYALKKTPDGWKAFDVIIAGVSYVTTYQNEFQSEVRRTSMAALIKRLQTATAPTGATAAKASGGSAS